MLALTAVGDMVDIADNGKDVQRDRLRVSTRKTIAERLCPDVFAPPKTDGGNVPLGSLAEIFKAVSNQGHKLPDIVDGEYESVEE